ncbi:MAG: FkbM family methyltransferase [Gemmatimonadota bacterium]|nr:FkbM family methyltransferase [Gemmatimonadota bacterium]
MSAMNLLTPITLDLSGPRGDVRVRYAFDLESEVQRGMHTHLTEGRFYEEATSQLFASVLKPGDTFIDIGAHVGYFSMLAAALVGPEGEVVSFEPSPGNYRQLLEHIALNGFTNVLPFHLALGDREQVMPLHLNADNDGGHALWDVGLHEANEKSRATPIIYPAYVTRLDRVLQGRPIRSLKAIKLDIEGSEVLALRGSVESIARHQVPFIVAEVNRTGLELMGTSENELRALMTGLGYETWIIQEGSGEVQPLADDMMVVGNFVFNLLFRRPGAVIG